MEKEQTMFQMNDTIEEENHSLSVQVSAQVSFSIFNRKDKVETKVLLYLGFLQLMEL
jgi:hypothetical protein